MIDFPGFIDIWSATLWRASCQGTVLVMIVWAVIRFLPSIPVRVQCWLWRLVILKFLVAFFWTAPVKVPILPPEKPATAQLIAASSTSLEVEEVALGQKFSRPPSRWFLHSPLAIPFIAWATVVGSLLVRIGSRCREGSRMRYLSRPITDERLLDQLATVGKSSGLRRLPRLLEMDGSGSPMLVRIVRPSIIIPATTLSRLDHSERATVIAHELAHARRGDLFWNLMTAIARAAFFFHPLLWLAGTRLRLAHEIAADGFAIALQRNDPVSYGNVLVSILSKLGPEQLLPTVFVGTAGSHESIKERLVAMRFMKPASVRVGISCGVLLAAVGAIGVIPWTAVAADETAVKTEQPKAATEADAREAKLVVTKAFYGELPDGTKADVTEKVVAMIKDNALSVEASNDNFGDPVEGVEKKLTVEYTAGGVSLKKTVNEGQTLSISAKATKIVIRKAVYGDLPDGAKTDVTDKVAEKVNGDSLSVEATNDNFGDPADGIVKKLKVDYTFNGKELSKTVNEDQTLTISEKGE